MFLSIIIISETMGESNLVINNRELHYKGIFRASDLFQTINKLLTERGYGKNEKKTEEVNTEEGRRSYIELRPSKGKSNYISLQIRIKITLDHVTSVVEDVNGVPNRFEKGDIDISFDGWVKTDYSGRWTQHPWVYFMKGIINKYVYQFQLESKHASEIFVDTAYVYAGIRNLLNSYSGKKSKPISEDEVKKMVEMQLGEDMKKDFGESTW